MVYHLFLGYMGGSINASINGGPPKWMVYNEKI